MYSCKDDGTIAIFTAIQVLYGESCVVYAGKENGTIAIITAIQLL